MGNVNMEASQINYRGGEKKMSVEEALKNTSGEAAAIAQLQTDVLNLNSNKANQITIAPFFSAEASYEVGDLVYYNGLSYRCTNAHEGEWDADDFAATTIAGELDTLKSGLTNVETGKVNKINAEINGLFRNSVLPLVNQQLINTEYNETTERGVIFIGNPATIDALALQTKYGTVTVEDLVRLTNQIPGAPANDGTYHLSVTVSGGTPTYSWMSA